MLNQLKLSIAFTLMAGFLFVSCAKDDTQNPPTNTATQMDRMEAKITGTFEPAPTGDGDADFDGTADETLWTAERIITDPNTTEGDVKIKTIKTTSNILRGQTFVVKYFITGTDTLIYFDNAVHSFESIPLPNITVDTADFVSAFGQLSAPDQAKGITPRLYFIGSNSISYYTTLPSFQFVPSI